MTNYTDIMTARTRLLALTDTSSITRATEPPYYSAPADIANEMLRDMLCLDDDERIDETNIELQYYRDNSPAELDPAYDDLDIDALYNELRDILTLIRPDEYSRDFLSRLRLDYSICPMHCHDYAICFDDDIPECAAIRAYFPNHDT